MARPTKIRRILPVFIILFMAPIIIILLFKLGKNKYKELPYYGEPVGLAPNGDTIRHAVPAFRFLDQNNQSYGSDNLKDKIYLVDFFAMNNKDAAKKLTENMKEVQDRFRKNKDFRVISVLLDEPRDNPAAMKQFAEANNIKTDQWHFLSASPDSVLHLLGNSGFLLRNEDFVKSDRTPPYSPDFILVDKAGHIRGKYIGIDKNNVEDVVGDVQTLNVYYARKASK